MQAVILAGGKGTRLKPYTISFPKPLVPLGNYPVLEVIIRQLAGYGFKKITILTGHLAELIEAYFSNGKRWGVEIEYIRESVPLNTAGALKLIKSSDDNFLVMNGDILTTLDYRAFFSHHLNLGANATIAAAYREAQIDFGVLNFSTDGLLKDYIEKPVYQLYVSTGVYMLSRLCLELIGDGEPLGMPDLLLRIKDSGKKVYCYKSDFYWLDIGRVDDYEKAQEEFAVNKFKFFSEEADD